MRLQWEPAEFEPWTDVELKVLRGSFNAVINNISFLKSFKSV